LLSRVFLQIFSQFFHVKVLKGRLVTFKVSHFTILAFGMLVGQTFQ